MHARELLMLRRFVHPINVCGRDGVFWVVTSKPATRTLAHGMLEGGKRLEQTRGEWKGLERAGPEGAHAYVLAEWTNRSCISVRGSGMVEHTYVYICPKCSA